METSIKIKSTILNISDYFRLWAKSADQNKTQVCELEAQPISSKRE
jgi:hypothetical protein